MNTKQPFSNDVPYKENNLIFADLISVGLSSFINIVFESEKSEYNVHTITRAFYVMNDLRHGISIDKIETYRLKSFNVTLINYLFNNGNQNDQQAMKLWQNCELILYRRSESA